MVTALFVDILGSTELGQDLDPEEARAIIDPALALMIDAVRRYDGYVVQSTGDGIFALFGAPVAREDHPQRTLYTAMRMQDEIRRYSARLRAEGRPPIQIRVPAAWKIDGRGHALVRRITQMPLRPLLVGIWDVRNGSEADAAGSDDHVR